MVDLGLLYGLVKRGLVGEVMHGCGEPPAEPNGVPNSFQRGLGIRFDALIVLLVVVLIKRGREIMHV